MELARQHSPDLHGYGRIRHLLMSAISTVHLNGAVDIWPPCVFRIGDPGPLLGSFEEHQVSMKPGGREVTHQAEVPQGGGDVLAQATPSKVRAYRAGTRWALAWNCG